MPRSYQKLFKQKVVITNLNRRSLGFRLFADDLITFFLAAFILMILDSYTPLILVNFVMNRWLFIAGGAFLFTWAARKLDPDGKPLVRYLFGAVAYPFRSHVSDGWTKKARQLVWRKGRVTRRKDAAKVVWTRGDLPLPVKVYGENWEFESGTHLDVHLRRGRAVLKKAGRFRRPGRHQVSGLRPGRYKIQGRRLLRWDD